jgi:hypothetical protein
MSQLTFNSISSVDLIAYIIHFGNNPAYSYWTDITVNEYSGTTLVDSTYYEEGPAVAGEYDQDTMTHVNNSGVNKVVVEGYLHMRCDDEPDYAADMAGWVAIHVDSNQ